VLLLRVLEEARERHVEMVPDRLPPVLYGGTGFLHQLGRSVPVLAVDGADGVGGAADGPPGRDERAFASGHLAVEALLELAGQRLEVHRFGLFQVRRERACDLAVRSRPPGARGPAGPRRAPARRAPTRCSAGAGVAETAPILRSTREPGSGCRSAEPAQP